MRETRETAGMEEAEVMKRMTEKEKMREVIRILAENMRSDCALESGGDPFRLLVMARLSAQCTDLRVNAVSKKLFIRFPDAEAFAAADVSEIEELIRPCGLFRTKADNIKNAALILCRDHGGKVPSDMESLLALPGVGRKIANLVRGDVYGLGGIVADTHCIRICGRLGFYPETEKDAVKVEKILAPLVPENEQTDLCHRLVWFGRSVCSARSPRCGECPLAGVCAHIKKV